MSIAVVWLKRDLRLHDHEPLVNASITGLPVLLVYCFEPMLLNDAHYSKRHWKFVTESLNDIAEQIPKASLFISNEGAIRTFENIHQLFTIKVIFSHQEIGLNNTFERDKAVLSWCEQYRINWYESSQGAVIRGLSQRQKWDENWQKVMRSSCQNVDFEKTNWFNKPGLSSCLPEMNVKFAKSGSAFQQGGERIAQAVLSDFYVERGRSYAYSLSSPLLSQQHCSRLSPYLAWGNISLRQVYQSVLKNWKMPGWRRSLVAFSSRLHWHCHFIQKFESEHEMEFRHVNRGYTDMPRYDGDNAHTRLIAWQQGKTGIPMVDACMRCLHQTGYINFRMRAMLVSFLCHHLGLDWRLGVKHLAQLFLDFEPGIHYSQFQMQAGVTGINTIRIYNPVKQGEEKDPEGLFVKTWIPELNDVPAPLVHSPWLLSAMEQMMYGVALGSDYPEPIVDLKQSYKAAQALLWSWRKKPVVAKEAARLLKRHVRPN